MLILSQLVHTLKQQWATRVFQAARLNCTKRKKCDMYLRDIIEVTVSQTAIAATSKRHDNAPVCKLKIKRGGIRDTVRGWT